MMDVNNFWKFLVGFGEGKKYCLWNRIILYILLSEGLAENTYI
jgi:hypothetical protein